MYVYVYYMLIKMDEKLQTIEIGGLVYIEATCLG